MNSEELTKILLVAKRFGVSELSMGELSFKFDLTNRDVFISGESKIPVEGNPTEDEMVLWSTPFMPSHTENTK